MSADGSAAFVVAGHHQVGVPRGDAAKAQVSLDGARACGEHARRDSNPNLLIRRLAEAVLAPAKAPGQRLFRLSARGLNPVPLPAVAVNDCYPNAAPTTPLSTIQIGAFPPLAPHGRAC